MGRYWFFLNTPHSQTPQKHHFMYHFSLFFPQIIQLIFFPYGKFWGNDPMDHPPGQQVGVYIPHSRGIYARDSAALCFKQLFHIAYGYECLPLLATILCVWQFISGSNNLLCRISLVGKQKQIQLKQNKKTRHRTDFEANLWPETADFCWP